MPPYLLRQSLSHHSLDVRALTVINDHKFVSGSRDKTCVVWETVDESHFFPMKKLVGGEHFINCVCVIAPNDKYTDGLLITGSQDNKVLIYEPSSQIPINICRGHQNAVSALCVLSETTFASGSWDGTIKIWHIDRALCIATHTHHNGAVFAILKLTDNLLLSAAADKLINVYKLPDIDILRGIPGHNDCVRGLAALDGNEFLSCSNDGTIRRWNADTGVSLGVLHTTDSFIYSVSALRDCSLIVCGCEENKVIIIDQGEIQELIVPAISVWSVAIFPSRDIITASSDGVIRIFTANQERQADKTELDEYNMLGLMAMGKANPSASSMEIDEKSLKSLPGPEALTKPGSREGQILLVSEDDKAICYQWSNASNTWIMIGDVTGMNTNDQKTKKIMFEGQEYDFVFDVDVEEGSPPLKLPYSYGDNPFGVAESFLLKYNLPASFKMDIINFILKNVPERPSIGTGYFQTKESNEQSQSVFVYAVENFVLAKNIDVPKAKEKLTKLANSHKTSDDKENNQWIDELVEMVKNNVMPSDDTLLKIEEALKWPPDQVFPILDLLRVAVTNPLPNSKLCSEHSNINFIELFDKHTQNQSSLVNNMLIIRFIGNMVIFEPGKILALKHFNTFLEQCKVVALRGNKTPALEISLANFIVNITIIHLKANDHSKLEEILKAGLYILERVQSKEAMCRIIAGIGSAVLKMDKVKISQSNIDYLNNLATNMDSDELSIKSSRMAQDLVQIIKPKLLLET